MSMFPTGSDKEVEYLLNNVQVLANKVWVVHGNYKYV